MSIVSKAEANAGVRSQGGLGWTTARHHSYATTDQAGTGALPAFSRHDWLCCTVKDIRGLEYLQEDLEGE